MRPNQTLVYPIVVLGTVGFILFSILFMVHKMGLSVNPPQPDVEVSSQITPYVVWKSEEGWSATSIKADYSIFKSATVSESNALPLRAALAEGDQEAVLFNVKSDLGKEGVLSFLKLLSEFSFKQVFIVSPFENTLENMKKVEPRFWYAPSPKSWVKWSVFSSYFIETIYGMKGDFLFIDSGERELLSERLRSEIKRRNPLVFETGKNDLKINFSRSLSLD